MRKVSLFFGVLLFSLFVAHSTQGYVTSSVSFDNGRFLQVEVAQTPSELAAGLMHREGLEADSGMLFIFESEARHEFWMKNMLFSIDIIWIDSDYTVVDIVERAPPCREDICPDYVPEGMAKYVLEVPAGFASSNHVSIGQRVGLNGG